MIIIELTRQGTGLKRRGLINRCGQNGFQLGFFADWGFYLATEMGAMVCIDISQQQSPRESASFQRSWNGNGFLVQNIDYEDFFCLAAEKRPIKNRTFHFDPASLVSEGEYDSNTHDADSEFQHFSKLKQKRRCFLREMHQAGSYKCLGLDTGSKSESQSAPRIDTTFAEKIAQKQGSACIKLKFLKPLPSKTVAPSTQGEQGCAESAEIDTECR